jgi:hypothetical protein
MGGSATGTGMGGSATGTGMGGSATGMGGSATGMAVEDCLDGIDNDGNQLVDCADPACTPDHECVPLPPTEWSEPQRIVDEALTAPALTCPDSGMADSYFQGPGDPATCAPCQCGTPNVGCSPPVIACWYNQSTCQGGATVYQSASCGAASSCPSTCNNPHRCGMVQASQVGGGCPASGGEPTVGPMWQGKVSVCSAGPLGGGCGADAACVPVEPAPFDGPACTTRVGDHTCPTGYPNRVDLYTGGTDTRDCDACTCDTSSFSCTTGTATMWDDNGCSVGGIDLGMTCTDVAAAIDNGSASFTTTPGTLSGTTCNPIGGSPIGEVTPQGQVTLCCE